MKLLSFSSSPLIACTTLPAWTKKKTKNLSTNTYDSEAFPEREEWREFIADILILHVEDGRVQFLYRLCMTIVFMKPISSCLPVVVPSDQKCFLGIFQSHFEISETLRKYDRMPCHPTCGIVTISTWKTRSAGSYGAVFLSPFAGI